ncbi:hypothetical protein QAD02_022082 [Eretmocerus hayati]|uniref:Uncharacterized protein n=1 Tax=Eretmocerus hayati TaxID=131215 RepID=A0ACC2PS30_9HYME|nr:hypothetical protein QAD02_022082 [Eretmocerus hayati]
MDDDYQRYRREQEEAVSNQSGSSAMDVFFVLIPNASCILAACTMLTLCGPYVSSPTKLLVEFSMTIVPIILCVTVLAEKTVSISQVLLIIAAGNILSILAVKPKDSVRSSQFSGTQRLPFLTNFRAMTNIITVVCILAVDFKCFPRKFAKTETYGYSLMDLGVGLFLMANAFVAPEARRVTDFSMNFHAKGFVQILKECVPLLVLGFGRLVAVEVLGYQRHVTEYGVHWNFFLTLAGVKLFTEVLSKKLTTTYSMITGVWILIMHEYALSTKGLKEWVLSDAPRDDILSANREGWVSIPGYVGLYLIGIALGRLIYSTLQNNENQLVINIKLSGYEFHVGYSRSMLLTVEFYLISNFSFVVTYYCERYFGVSRRLANSGYCAWMVTMSALMITFLLLIDVLLECIANCVHDKTRRRVSKHLIRENLKTKEKTVNVVKTLEIFEAVNDNGLLFFLFANVMTGAINMSMKTLRADDQRAVAIITAYMVANLSFVVLRYRGKNLLRTQKIPKPSSESLESK